MRNVEEEFKKMPQSYLKFIFGGSSGSSFAMVIEYLFRNTFLAKPPAAAPLPYVYFA